MTVRIFRDLLAQQPFKPFRVVVSSGQSYEVRHPEMAWVTRTDLPVGTGGDGDGVPENFRICSPPHVASIEPVATTAPTYR